MVEGIFASFKTLSDATGEGDEVSKATFLDFVREFSRSPMTRRITTATANIIFSAVDKDYSNCLDKEEFCNICGVMQYDFWTTHKYSIVKDKYPEIWNNPHFKNFVEFVENGLTIPYLNVKMNFDLMMNLVLMVNLVLVVIESTFDLQGWKEPLIL